MIVSITLVMVAMLWHIVVFRLAAKIGLVKPSFRKVEVMASYGVVSFAYMAAAVCSLAILGYADWTRAKLYLVTMGAMWLLGAADDLYGSREVGGFAGHFRKLLVEGKVTTGALKAVGGGVIALAAGWNISQGDLSKWLPASVVIALSANLLNLFDLRPGRAAAVFFLGLGVTYITALGRFEASWVVAGIALVALIWAIPDSRGKAMMGDAGSNSLGAALGLTIATSAGIVFQLVAIACIVAVHLYSEKHSISALIERNAVLRYIDTRLGVR